MFSWRTTLSSQLFNNSPRVNVPSLYAELAFTLLTYGFALSNLASTTTGALGAYEYEHMPDADRRTKDERLAFAVKLLCRAAGVFAHIAHAVVPAWDKARPDARKTRPPDVTADVALALSQYARQEYGMHRSDRLQARPCGRTHARDSDHVLQSGL